MLSVIETRPAVIVRTNRAGRKAKVRVLKGGRPAKDRTEDIRDVARNQPIRRDQPRERQLDPLLEHSAGCLLFKGFITRQEYDAGGRYARIVNQRRALMASHDPNLQPLAGSSGDISEDEAKRRVKAYNAAVEALDDCGNKVLKAVNHVFVWGRWADSDHPIVRVKLGLSTLVKHFGIGS